MFRKGLGRYILFSEDHDLQERIDSNQPCNNWRLMQCSSLVGMARAIKVKEKESQMVRASKGRMAKALLDTLTKEKERERARTMVRDRSTSQKFQAHCNFCGKFGHKESDCREKKGGGKSDAGKKGVGQVEEVGATDGATSSGGGASNSGAVKMISFAPAVDCHDDDPVVDLTVFDNSDGGVFALHVSLERVRTEYRKAAPAPMIFHRVALDIFVQWVVTWKISSLIQVQTSVLGGLLHGGRDAMRG